MKLTLPYPISANEYWRTAVVTDRAGRPMMMRGKEGARPYANTYVSKEAKSYKRKISIIAFDSGIRDPIPGRVAVSIELYPHRPLDWEKRARRNPMGWDDEIRCIDLDNALKVLIDALRGVAYKDDAWVRKISAQRMEPDHEGERVIVVIEPIIQTGPQLAIFQSAPAHDQVH